MKRGASERRPAAVVSFGQSVSPKKPFRKRCESTLASEASRRKRKLFFGHFQRKNGDWCLTFQRRILSDVQGKAVFPMLGRPAIMISSDFCKPEVKSSIFSKPVGTPVISFFAGIKIFDGTETVLDNIPNRKKRLAALYFRKFQKCCVRLYPESHQHRNPFHNSC